MHRSWISVAGVLFCAAAAAQTLPSDIAGNNIPADQMLRDMLHPTTAPSRPAPASRSELSVIEPEGTPSRDGPRLIREGTEIDGRQGRLEDVPGSQYPVFVFDPAKGRAKLPALPVLPDLKLMAMENAQGATRRSLNFTVSGTVTEYRDKNYILLYSDPMEFDSDMIRASAPLISAPATPLLPSTRPLTADQMLDQMLATEARPTPQVPILPPPAVDQTSGSHAVAPGAPVLNLRREQSQIVDQVARLTRTPGTAQQELALESDGQSMQDPPLIILPNLKLQEMEDAAAGNRDPRFSVTGTVTEYRGRNYILLEKVVVIPDAAEQF